MRRFIAVVFVLLLLLVGCDGGPGPGLVDGTEEALGALRPTVTAVPTRSDSSGSGCVELYVEGVLVYQGPGCGPGVTPVPSPTITSTLTAVPSPTVTGLPSPGPTLTPKVTVTAVPTVPGEHDVTSWHSPMFGHHHGANPQDSPLVDMFLQQTGQYVGYAWVSSPTENLFPFPVGKHNGYTFLLENETGCPQFNREDEGLNCINKYLLEVHSLGDAHAIIGARIHSNYGVFEVCLPDGSQCGLVATGGHADYGVLHNGYKQANCRLGSDPEDYPYDSNLGLNQPPYRTGHATTLRPPRGDDNPQFWSSIGPNAVMGDVFPEGPNHILGLAWTGVDAWAYIDGTDCGNVEAAVMPCPDGTCGFNHSRFQVFTVRLQNLPTERPFVGFTDVNGHVDPDCAAASAVCVPLVIEATVPQGDALMNRSVQQGDCSFAPCQEFDDGAPLVAPGFE